MASTQKKVRIASNPKRSTAKKSRPNAAAKKGTYSMAKNGNKKKASMKKKPNPMTGFKKKRKKNPSGIAAIIGNPSDVAVAGVSGLVSAVATRQIPQLIMGSGNTGVEGYLANLATALLTTWAAGAFVSAKAAVGALTGGMVILLDRILTEQISPIGPYLTLSGVGDANAMTNLGTIRDGYYFHPGLVDGNGNMITPPPVTAAAVAAVLAQYPQLANPVMMNKGGGTMGAVNPSELRRHVASGQLLSSRFQGRFNQSQN